MKGSVSGKFRTTVALVLTFGLVVHVILALVITFFGDHIFFRRSKPGKLYEYLVHLGPFYREESIRSSPHLIIQSADISRDVSVEHAENYQKSLWKINELTVRDFARRAADEFHRSKRSEQSTAFRKLTALSSHEFDNIRKGDSVHWIYITRWYDLELRQHRADTTFSYSFTW